MTTPNASDPACGPVCQRRTTKPGEPITRGVERDGSVWRIRSFEAAKHVLRERDATTQAGFNSEVITKTRPQARRPVLFMDGPEHRTQRAAIARFFAPTTVAKRYGVIMERAADDIVARLQRDGRLDLSAAALRYSVEVAAQVIGLTESDVDGMARRLEAFFATPPSAPVPGSGRFARVAGAVKAVRSAPPMFLFNRRDVLPAIAARRARPQQDVISHLIEHGYSDEEILIECVTYGAAGMVTTREFLAMATWHLLSTPELKELYLSADDDGRAAVLDEILRLEPVVGHLFRRTTRELTVPDGDQKHVIPAGALVDLSIRAANADEPAVGTEPLHLCPGRQTASGVRPEVLSFGDGAHVCPGNSLALRETDILLKRLLDLPVEMSSTPRIEWDELISGYAVRNITLRLRAG